MEFIDIFALLEIEVLNHLPKFSILDRKAEVMKYKVIKSTAKYEKIIL